MHYYAKDRTVTNLDGRVDDGTTYRSVLNRESAWQRLRSRGITHLIDTVWGEGFWRDVTSKGKILFEKPYGENLELRMVVVELPPTS